jgi:hypothetical protein
MTLRAAHAARLPVASRFLSMVAYWRHGALRAGAVAADERVSKGRWCGMHEGGGGSTVAAHRPQPAARRPRPRRPTPAMSPAD